MEVIRLRVCLRRDGSTGDAMKVGVNTVRTGSHTRLATHVEAMESRESRYEHDDVETCRLTARSSEDCLEVTVNTLELLVARMPQEESVCSLVSSDVGRLARGAEPGDEDTLSNTVMTKRSRSESDLWETKFAARGADETCGVVLEDVDTKWSWKCRWSKSREGSVKRERCSCSRLEVMR